MKRHPGLRELSVDHHHGLVHAHRLIKAASSRSPASEAEPPLLAVAREFLRFWQTELNFHFREEEEALLPFFARYGKLDQPCINQMLREHILIRRYVADLMDGLSADASLLSATLLSLGQQLEAHIRLEERVVFPLIEATLPEPALARLPDLCAAYEAAEGHIRNETLGNIAEQPD